jgi:nicotinamide-nucleotide amidase
MLMSSPDDLTKHAEQIAESISTSALRDERRVAVAESLTGGKIACHLGAAPDSAAWFQGGVVAYASDVKHRVLGVPDGPVVSEPAAAAMAQGVARLLGADTAVAVTGAGGPDPQDGQPPGTVWFGLSTNGSVTTECQHWDGDPEDVLEQTTVHALTLLERALSGRAAPG